MTSSVLMPLSGQPQSLWLPDCVAKFNAIVEAAACGIIVSSAWRSHIHDGHMTLKGFEYLLRSHGVRGSVFGCTRPDGEGYERWQQIREWLDSNRERFNVTRYIVLDDWRDAGDGHPFILTDPRVGLTAEDARRAIELLNSPTTAVRELQA